MRRLTLILVEVGRIERAPTVQDKLRFLSRYVGDLELADCGATESGQSAGVRYDARYIAERTILAGAIVDGVTRADRILHANVVLKIAARKEVVGIAGRAMQRRARLDRLAVAIRTVRVVGRSMRR